MSITLLTLGFIFILQITIFKFYKVSTLITGVIFALIFGELSLKLIDSSAVPQYFIDSSIFMLLFYLGLTKPSGEFFKKYILKYKQLSLVSTVLTISLLSITALLIGFDTHIAVIVALSLGAISISTNSLIVDYLQKQKGEMYKLLFANGIPNSGIVIVIFTFLLSLFNSEEMSFINILIAVGKVSIFILLAFAISRYIYPRISQKFKNANIHLALLLANSLLQSYIATLFGLHFAIGAFFSTLFIPELFLKMKIIEPIREKVDIFNNYITLSIFGLVVGLNIDTGILFDYTLFTPFAILTIAVLVIQYLATYFSLLPAPLQKLEKKIVSIGTLAKGELSLIMLFLALNYELINRDIFTSSIILIAILNLIVWHKFKSMES